jgi:hypothetical protein
MKKRRWQRLTALLTIAVLAVVAAQALAADPRVNHPRDPSYATVWNHRWITVCDRQADGHEAYVRYSLWFPGVDPSETYRTAGDKYGGGCLRGGTPLGAQVYKWVICVQYEGCSGYGKQWPRPLRAG